MAAAILAGICGVLFFYHLDESEVSSQAEARVLLTAKEMNEKATWLVPTVAGEERWEKPPLYVWSVKFFSLFDREGVTTLVGRLPGAISMSLLVLLGAWWTYTHVQRYPRVDEAPIKPEVFGLLAGLMLATNPEILKLARDGIADSTFALFCFGSLYCLGESFETRRSFYASRPWRQWVLAAYVLIGLAMLTKGPAAFLFVLIPYIAMCATYRMFRADWIHLVGIALALAIGGWWYLLAVSIDTGAKQIFLNEILSKRFGAGAEHHRPFYFYVTEVLPGFLPWLLIAIAMVFRSLRGGERTPTLVTWSCSLLAGVIWLSILGSKRDRYFLPVAPFIPLLAVDALARWNFDSKSGGALRLLLHGFRIAGILGCLGASLLISSDWGIGLAAALTLTYTVDIARSRKSRFLRTWHDTVYGAWMVALVMGACWFVYIGDGISRESLLSRNRSFIEQVHAHLPENAKLYLYGEEDVALYSHLYGELLPVVQDLDELPTDSDAEIYILSDEDVSDLTEDPALVPVVEKLGGSKMRPRAALFRYEPRLAAGAEGVEEALPPLRFAVLGDAGRDDPSDQKELAKLMAKLNKERPLHGVLSLGDILGGNSRRARLDFHHSFERPYKKLLKAGVPFHGLLGRDDQDVAGLVIRYPGLQMGARRHYARDFYGGLARIYMLDSVELSESSASGGGVWDWLEKDLASSDAAWKIVGLHRPIASLAPDATNEEGIAGRLRPLLDLYGVRLVLWSREPWYQRVEDPENGRTMLGVGWSGIVKSKDFEDHPNLGAAYGTLPGFVLLEITPGSLAYTAINIEGEEIDSGVLERATSQVKDVPEPAATSSEAKVDS